MISLAFCLFLCIFGRFGLGFVSKESVQFVNSTKKVHRGFVLILWMDLRGGGG